jgi:membrane protein YqaA with SNARE-associated domain
MLSLTIHKLAAINIFLNRRGLGLLLLGVLDGSIIPTFGLLDQFAGVFAARDQSLWVYYAAISTIGATIGALTTYRLGRKLGSQSLEAKFGVKRTLTVRRLLKRWEFAAVFVPALAPPPFPTSLFLFAAGSLNYRIQKYLCAVVLGKAIRHGVITYFISHYSLRRFGFPVHSGQSWAQSVIVTLAITGVAELVLLFGRWQKLPDSARDSTEASTPYLSDTIESSEGVTSYVRQRSATNSDIKHTFPNATPRTNSAESNREVLS